jgi:hypothetical protein
LNTVYNKFVEFDMDVLKEDDILATSSITKNFVVSGAEQVEKFADAIEASYQESLIKLNKTKTLQYHELRGADELNEFTEKWKKAHE